ncbi:MAG: adenosylmethionine--8-amino-7-oxononanoate transaminase [Acidobacteria bacterium]|nr:adenosylmethionine--8-amino-7-oxononanoate transaminase [Acidobacteriota bacterium]
MPDEWVKWDRQFIWHPFTQMSEYLQEDPLIIERGRGNYLYDIRGKQYLDGVSSLWCNLFGHRRKELDRAISVQLNRIAHSTLLGISNVPAIELAKRLVEITPPRLTKVFYSDNGSTAVEVALKMAFQYWQQAERGRFASRTKFLTLVNAYHGDTIGAVSLGGIDLFHGAYTPLLFETYKAPSPYCYRCPLGLRPDRCQMECADEVERMVKKHQRTVAALVMEPMIQAAGGMIAQPPGYLRRMRELCTKYGVFLILDEVATGFGRTGCLFACQREGVEPDFLCLSKGLTGGYLPMAATLTTSEVFEAFLGRYEEFKTFFHGHTYTGNPLAASAALATLDIFEHQRVLEKLPRKIKCLRRRLQGLADLTHVGDIRQAGFIVGIELIKSKRTKVPYAPKERMGYRVCLSARRQGILIRPLGDIIVLMPPLSMTRPQIDLLADSVYHSIRLVTDHDS